MNNSKIEWTDKTWNPVTGCTKVSQGCKNCYAERMYERFHGHGSFKNVICHSDRLQQPFKWKKPSMVFVNSMSDLFHEAVPDAFIFEVFRIMYETRNLHTYQLLTKRPERMHRLVPRIIENGMFGVIPKNVWLGVSVEDQQTADERLPLLIDTPAHVRFLSCEPLLGKITLTAIPVQLELKSENDNVIHWIIAGGESGPGARPMHPNWVRSLLYQSRTRNISFFFKQWGEYSPYLQHVGMGKELFIHDQEFHRVGKKVAGRLLDGIEYNEFPKV